MRKILIVLGLSLFPTVTTSAPGDFCAHTAGTFGDGNAGAIYTQQQIDDVLNFVNSATATQLDACTRIDATEAASLVSSAPYDGIGTLGADEAAGDVPNHIDSVVGVSDAASDNDLAGLRDCAPVTTSCAAPLPPEPFSFTTRFATNQHGAPSDQCTTPMCTNLVSLIDAATTSVDFAIYGLRGAPAVITALQNAVNRGVAVRGVVDTQTGSCTADLANFLYTNTHDLIFTLGTSRVKCDTQSHSSIMHNKFFIIDGDQVLMGTANVSDTGLVSEYNANTYVIFDSTNLASIYTAEFNEMWVEGKFHGGKTNNTIHVIDNWTDGTTVVESYFSPSDDAKTNAVFKLLDNATSTLDIQMFFLTDQGIADRIIAAHNRGVAVRVIIDASGGGSPYSKTTALCNAGIEVKTENWGAKQHNKLGVADSGVAGSGTVVVGSMNWTAAGNNSNDENTIYVENDAFAAGFQADFNAKWADLAQVPACTRIAAEGNASSTCTNNNCQTQCTSGACCDGADNDHDNTVDAMDNGCTDQNPLGPGSACEPDPGNPGAGTYGNGGISEFTNQQIHDTLSFVNGATATELDACTGISSKEASNLVSEQPYGGIGTIGSDEGRGDVPGHIDSVKFISDQSNDNDLVHLRNCAPVTNECDSVEATGPNCVDGLDNDGDGFIDAADFDCRPILGLESEDTQARCTDGVDNDGDGFIDAVDFDCGPVLGL